MNSSQDIILLAIAPGKRELGIAVFVGADLIYASVKTIRQRGAGKFLFKEITCILQKIFKDFSIKVVVIKAISQYQKLSPNIEMIVERIKFESAEKGLKAEEIKLEEIKCVLCKSKKGTEKRAFEMLLMTYPELKRFWQRPNKWQNDYYAFLFSAVAVGAVYLKTHRS